MFTVADFVRVLQGMNQFLLAEIILEFPEEVEPYLDKIQAKLIEKGVIPAAAAPADFTPSEQAVLPLLRELDNALRSGGSEAALEAFRRMANDPTQRSLLRAVVQGSVAA